MHLHAKFVVGVDELEQQRECLSECVIDLLSYEFIKVNLNQFVYVVAGKIAVLDNGFVSFKSAQFPAFADALAVFHGLVHQCAEFVSSPDSVFQYGLEFQWI